MREEYREYIFGHPKSTKFESAELKNIYIWNCVTHYVPTSLWLWEGSESRIFCVWVGAPREKLATRLIRIKSGTAKKEKEIKQVRRTNLDVKVKHVFCWYHDIAFDRDLFRVEFSLRFNTKSMFDTSRSWISRYLYHTFDARQRRTIFDQNQTLFAVIKGGEGFASISQPISWECYTHNV